MSSPLVALGKAGAFCFLVRLSLNPLGHDDTVAFLFLTWYLLLLERRGPVPRIDEGGCTAVLGLALDVEDARIL